MRHEGHEIIARQATIRCPNVYLVKDATGCRMPFDMAVPGDRKKYTGMISVKRRDGLMYEVTWCAYIIRE